MPLYVYKCNKCGWIGEKYRNVKDRAEPLFCKECDSVAYRSFSDECAKPQIYETYWDQHLANEDYPEGRLCTGNRQKSMAMKEMGFGLKENKSDLNKKELNALRNKIPLKKHFSGLSGKLKQRNLRSNTV